MLQATVANDFLFYRTHASQTDCSGRLAAWPDHRSMMAVQNGCVSPGLLDATPCCLSMWAMVIQAQKTLSKWEVLCFTLEQQWGAQAPDAVACGLHFSSLEDEWFKQMLSGITSETPGFLTKKPCLLIKTVHGKIKNPPDQQSGKHLHEQTC